MKDTILVILEFITAINIIAITTIGIVRSKKREILYDLTVPSTLSQLEQLNVYTSYNASILPTDKMLWPYLEQIALQRQAFFSKLLTFYYISLTLCCIGIAVSLLAVIIDSQSKLNILLIIYPLFIYRLVRNKKRFEAKFTKMLMILKDK